MKDKIEKLKQIISESNKLQAYADIVQDDWNLTQLKTTIENILKDFEKYKDKVERPNFYTELEVLLNKYSKDNIYKKPYRIIP